MPSYRAVRDQFSFLELCQRSDVAAEVTVDAARRLGVDAAIIFADILLPLIPMGLGLHFEKGDGPVVDRPIRTAHDVHALPKSAGPGDLAFVGNSIALARKELGAKMPIIGFAGAPFTVASYAIEGRGSRNFTHVKTFMYTQPAAWAELMTYIADLTARYLNMQIEAGADVVQLFDSWVGCLSPADYRDYVQPHVQRLIAALRPGTPVIQFGTMTGSLLELMRDAGGDVIGVDWRVDLAEAWNRLGPNVGTQGNMDPVALFADRDYVREAARAVLRRSGDRPGYIFNLGHGILPETPVDNVLALIETVHEYRRTPL